MEESSKDPAYKLLVVMMQSKDSLKHYTAYMDKYFRSKTFLNRDDPKLLDKIKKYLTEVKDEPQENPNFLDTRL